MNALVDFARRNIKKNQQKILKLMRKNSLTLGGNGLIWQKIK